MNDIILVNQATGKVRWGYVLGYLLLFLILPPVVGLPLVVSMVWKKPNAAKSDYYMLFLCVAAYFAAINATKAPGGDQINYTWAYLNVPTQGFIGSLKNIYGYKVAMGEAGEENISGEFMNGVYNYIGYYLTFGYYPVFAAIITFIDYYLIFIGLYRYAQAIKAPHIPIVCGVITLGFFYLFFNFTLHIQKQFLAQSIMMYVIGTYAYKEKMTKGLWGAVAMSFFTHASMILYFPFLLISQLRKRLSRTGLLILSACFMALVAFSPALLGSIASDAEQGALTYGIDKIANSEGKDDGSGGVQLWRLYLVGLPLALIAFRKMWINRKSGSDKDALILNIFFLLFLAIIAMYNQPLSQYRYFMMVYAFIPFLLPFVSDNTQTRNNVLISISFVMVAWFYFQFEKIIWDYASEIHIVLMPPVGLIFGNYYTL